MTTSKFGIDGIYDIRVMKKLTTLNLKTLVFDCNPRSPQFVQGYVIIDILKTLNVFDGKIVLKFEKEKDFMINSLVHSVLKDASIASENLEVWVSSECDWIKNPTANFKVHYSSYIREKEFIKNDLFKGFNFNASDFENITGGRTSGEQKLLVILQLLGGKSFEHSLTLEPFDSLPSALCDFLEIRDFVLKINSDIEVCYRNVDVEKLTHSFGMLKKNATSVSF